LPPPIPPHILVNINVIFFLVLAQTDDDTNDNTYITMTNRKLPQKLISCVSKQMKIHIDEMNPHTQGRGKQ